MFQFSIPLWIDHVCVFCFVQMRWNYVLSSSHDQWSQCIFLLSGPLPTPLHNVWPITYCQPITRAELQIVWTLLMYKLMINISTITQPANWSLRYISPVVGKGNKMQIASVIISSPIGLYSGCGITDLCYWSLWPSNSRMSIDTHNGNKQWKQVMFFFFLSMVKKLVDIGVLWPLLRGP